ncbi:discoidin domain-containing protein [Clostridium tarantellae]|uniref:F5/8 type C domain-containing protein n=1 Tax=Clostridium tarantellae TaxID=39493 RepID=A0A6I1MV48_9CLOT|nr:discoidin domain-containing protein [Clostridium tarantellae]MPQ44721.1 hypothetical protein [Clostridium tarantellae]
MKVSEKEFQHEFSVQAIDTLCPLVTFLNNNNIGTSLNEFNFSSGWNYETVRVNENYEGDSHWTIQSGAKVTIKFVATEFIIIATKDPAHGIMTISIDEDNPIDIDLYSNARIGKQQVFQSPVLSNIEHIIEIKCSGRKNASATGIAAYIDGIFVLNKNAPLIQNEIPSFNKAKIVPSNFQHKVSSQNIDTLCSLVTFLNDGKLGTSLNEFNFSSGWNYEKNKFDENYEGDSHWTNESGATVTIKFVGTEFIIIANKDPGYGIMTVSIDGDNPLDIDLYYNFHIGRQQVFQSPVLSNMEHLIEIKCSGRKNTNATGIKAYIDGIFVLNKNLALNKRAIASSKEYDYLDPNNVTDGVIEVISRWGSGNFNTGQQWIYIDLEERIEFDEIIINWATAHATIYRIEISNDANSWTSIYRTTTGNGGKDVITFNFKQNARFVRIYGEKNNPDIWHTMAIYEIEIYNRDSFIDIRGANLALKKKAVASAKEYDYLNPSNVTDGVIEFTSRWGSGDFNTGQQWIYIDLEEKTEFDEIIINWATAYATIYRIEISNDANSWTSIYRTTTGNGGKDVITFNFKQNARFVRVYGEKNNPDIWHTMAIYEIEIYNKNSFIDIKGANLALKKKAVASANEVDYLTPNLATDGLIELKSRWSSGNFNTGHQWIYIDLEERTEFNEIIINWAKAHATIYRIEISNDANSWTSIYRTTNSTGGTEIINLNPKQNARFVRVYCEKNNPDIWYTVAIYEIEIYNREFSKITSEVLSMDVNTVIEEIKELLVNKGDTKLNLPLVPKGFTIKVESSDFISIIDRNANIYTPLVDTNVNVNIKVSDENGNYSSKDFQVLVPGMYNTMGINKKPNVIPNLREWIGLE